MKKILVIFLWVISVSAFAQSQNITGKITDSSGEPLPGATVVVKGTTTGTSTNFDGNYELPNVSSETVLIFSFVGFIPQEITVGNQSTISVTMQPDAIGIEEVVAIGYGTVKKSDLTGSVATVATEEAYVAPVASLSNALQGRAAGVQVTSGGAPGSDASIVIRGGNSITAGNDPLYVIDGFIGAGNINSINPNDIEDMVVLRDASSTAIYGARGTNGVILITTKKGKQGKPVVNLRSSYGVQVLPEMLDNQTGSEFAAWRNSQASDQDNLPFDLNNLPGEETDWQDVMIQPAAVQDYQLSVGGGSDKAQYYLSTGYFSQDGIVRGTGFDRVSLRTNVDVNLSKVFKTGVNASISRTNSDNNNISFNSLLREDPLKPVYDEDGNYNIVGYGTSNPGTNMLADNTLNTNSTVRDRTFINTYLQATLAEKITLKSTFGVDMSTSKQDQFTPSTNPVSIRDGLLGQATVNQRNLFGWINENSIDYKETFGEHTFGALALISWQADENIYTHIDANEIPSDGVTVNALALAPVENTSISSTYTKTSMFGLVGRLNYNYASKYYVTASVRQDASSRLGENNKSAIFPSAAIAWNVAEESFFQNVSTIDRLKVRVSYGVTGNQNIPAYTTLSTLDITGTIAVANGGTIAGVQQGNLYNPNLKWETTTQFDLGFEISMYEGRLSAELDFYSKKTEDLLLNAAVPGHSGYTEIIQNVGSLKNRGVDLNLNGVIVSKGDFTFDASLNLSTFKSEVTDLGISSYLDVKTLPAPSGKTNSRLIVGQPVGTFYGSIHEGLDPETGDFLFKDISGPDGVPDGIYSIEYDQTVIGTANPDFYGGLQTNFKYKSFDLSAFFPFSYGGQNYNEEMFLASEVQVNNFAALRDNMWSASASTEQNNNATVPGVGNTTILTSSDFYLQDASFFRLGTLNFGYTLPSNLIKGISNFRLYFTGTNLFLIKSKDYLGFDPDVSSYADHADSEIRPGFDNIAYPNNRQFIFGLDVTF
jgi:TonB-linked SusC/RagA family outer membrane protein